MSDHFVMVWSDMLRSSINEHEAHVKWSFVVILLLCDKDGDFRCTAGNLSRLANIPIDQAEDAIEKLSAPDLESSSGEEEGRRIVPTGSNTWHVVNYSFYRNRQKQEELRQKWKVDKERQRRTGVDGGGQVVDTSGRVVDPVDIGVDVDVDVSPMNKKKVHRFIVPTVEEVQAYIDEKGLLVDAQGFIDFYESKGWMVGKNKMKSWQAACRRAQEWETNEKKFKGRAPKAEKPLGEFGRAAKAKTERLMAESAKRRVSAEMEAAAEAADKEA